MIKQSAEEFYPMTNINKVKLANISKAIGENWQKMIQMG